MVVFWLDNSRVKLINHIGQNRYGKRLVQKRNNKSFDGGCEGDEQLINYFTYVYNSFFDL